MVTIEETIISPLQQRAIDYCDKKQMPKIGRQIAVIAYMHGAQDQDRIAREEERERCIKVITKMLDDPCEYYSVDGYTHNEYVDEDKIREAIEEGVEP